MASFYLILYIYAGGLARGDSVTMVSIPQYSSQACEEAGNKASKLVANSAKELRFICIKGMP